MNVYTSIVMFKVMSITTKIQYIFQLLNYLMYFLACIVLLSSHIQIFARYIQLLNSTTGQGLESFRESSEYLPHMQQGATNRVHNVQLYANIFTTYTTFLEAVQSFVYKHKKLSLSSIHFDPAFFIARKSFFFAFFAYLNLLT